MKLVPRTDDPIAHVEGELQQERAAALGRIGRTFEQKLARLRDLRARAAGVVGEARAALVTEYRAAVADAKTWRFYLIVQREANGLRNHALVADAWVIPESIDAPF